MNSGEFGLQNALWRLVGCAAVVALCNPVHPKIIEIQALHMPVPAPLMVLEIALIICIHLYLLNRAYYALKLTGIGVFVVIYALAYTIAVDWLQASLGVYLWMKYFFSGLFALLYFYGVIFNHLDARIAGLVHNVDVR